HGDDAGVDARGVRCDARAAGRWTLDHSRIEPYFPSVQRTDDGVAGDDPIAKGTTFVRAPIVRRQEAVAEIEKCNFPAGQHHGSSFSDGHVVTARHADPASFVHASTCSRG